MKQMKKIVLLYWVKGGNVERAARKVYSMFNPDDIEMYDLHSFNVDTIENYDLIIWGGATIGAENWSDTKADNEWNRFFRKIEEHDLRGKYVAFFGLGDQVLYPDHFVDGLGIFKEEADKVNATVIGQWPVEGYKFTDSDGMHDGLFFGLALDEDNESHLTDGRVEKWTADIKKAVGL
jgi:flavodoxin I